MITVTDLQKNYNGVQVLNIENLAKFKELDFNEVCQYLEKTLNLINPLNKKKIILFRGDGFSKVILIF